MSKKLENKVVIVTGASKGIGAGIAKQMAAAGAKVVVNYASAVESAENVVNEIINAGGSAIAIQADVSKAADIDNLFKQTEKAYSKIDVLVNNAGVYEFAPLQGATEDSFRRIFDVNVLGVIMASQQAVKYFEARGGSIINISSFASQSPEPYSLVYAASKSAVDSITNSLSQELGGKNIRVNSILPGGTLTEGVAKLGLKDGDEITKKMIERTALGRMGTPDDIGHVAVFLATDDAYFITGQTIGVSGGFK